MERLIESMLLGLRWMLLPLYLALFVAVLTIYVMVARELFDIAAHLGSITDFRPRAAALRRARPGAGR